MTVADCPTFRQVGLSITTRMSGLPPIMEMFTTLTNNEGRDDRAPTQSTMA